MIKLIVAVLVLAVIMSGCSVIQYQTPDASFSYSRVMNQSISGLKVQKDLDSVTVSLDSQEAKNDEVLLEMSKNIKKALGILDKLQKKMPNLF